MRRKPKKKKKKIKKRKEKELIDKTDKDVHQNSPLLFDIRRRRLPEFPNISDILQHTTYYYSALGGYQSVFLVDYSVMNNTCTLHTGEISWSLYHDIYLFFP